jgi:hypothetical protein
MSRIRYERTDRLAPHPLLERVGTMSSLASHFALRAKKAGKNREDHKELALALDGDLAALRASIQTQGILEPIKICKQFEAQLPNMPAERWWIVDGRNRWLAACALGLKSIPVMRVAASAAPEIIAATVAGRRHYTKGATAYLACLIHPEMALAASGRRTDLATSALSAEVLAQKYAVSRRLLGQATELYRLLEGEGKPFRADAEASIWAGCGLGGVKSGVEFLIKNGSGPGVKGDPVQQAAMAAWTNYRKATQSVSEMWKTWDAMDATQRETALTGLQEWFAGAPMAVRAELEQSLKF